MRFEGKVSADSVAEVEPGQTVTFRVQGFGQREFVGHIARVNPAANVTSRQVEVLVDFAGASKPTLAGLYAEGRIQSRAPALMIPATAIGHDGDKAYAWRVEGATLSKVHLELGDLDQRSGAVAVKSGLNAGDQLLRYPTSTLKADQRVELTRK